MIARIILLTGESGVGKSYLVTRLLEHLQAPVNGFYTTKSQTNAEGEAFVHIRPAHSQLQNSWTNKTPETCVGKIPRSGKPMGFPDVFDTVGTLFLQKRETNIWIMDELGFMESEAHLFQQAVHTILDSDAFVIAVVKQRHTDFLDQVRAHPRALLYEVTQANREHLYDRLSSFFDKSC